MGLPQKGLRKISVDSVDYHWLVSVRKGTLHLTIEAVKPGQRLFAHFHFHDEHRKTAQGHWHFVRQSRHITSGIVKQVIARGLEKGWRPHERGLPALELVGADYEFKVPAEPTSIDTEPTVRRKERARDRVDDWRYTVSLDPEWRQRLFEAPMGQHFSLPADEQLDFHFFAFSDGWTESGWVVFGFGCVEFPEIVLYSHNPSWVL